MRFVSTRRWLANHLPANRITLRQLAFVYLALVLIYTWIQIQLMNGDLFDQSVVVSNGSHGHRTTSVCTDQIDVVYTWVNGSDSSLTQTLRAITNRLIVEELSGKCQSLGDGCANQTCLPLPAILIRPPLHHPGKYFDNIVKYEYFNQSASLIYFATLTTANEQAANCVRIIDGKVFLLTRLFLKNDSQIGDADTELKVDSLLAIKNVNFGAEKQEASRNDPLKYFSLATRKHLQLLNTTTAQSEPYLYIPKWRTSNLTRIVPLIESKVNQNDSSVCCTFKVDSPVSIHLQDEHFFHHPLANHNTRPNRFADNDELRFSLRSIHRNAAWIRNIYIVTNGQIPHWLNLEHPQVRLITHKEIFLNQSHLPTFSSSAIESHIHRIPGLSSRFLYLNDDVIVASQIYPDDFYTESGGFKVYLSWPVPNCATGCPLTWLNDGYCDQACNTSQCLWDGGDCVNKTTLARKSNPTVFTSVKNPNHCALNCLDNWLGDSFCDQICNHKECAYDMADCGTKHYGQFPSIQLNHYEKFYSLAGNASVVYFNLTEFLNIHHGEEEYRVDIKQVSYTNTSCLKVDPILNLRHKILVLLFNSSAPKETLTFSIETIILQKQFNFTIELHWDDSRIGNETDREEWNSLIEDLVNERLEPVTLEVSQNPPIEMIEIRETSWKFACEINVSLLPEEIGKQFAAIDWQHKEGILTDSGKELFYSQLKSLYANLICESPPQSLDPFAEFVRNEFNPNTTFRSRKLLDAYADSLVFVNHLYNQHFGVEARKAPAHMAHFVDRDIVYRMQRQFPQHFEQTSSHQIRHSKDMQFAFSYFYYLMNEHRPIDVNAIVGEFDSDHSRDLNLNELKTLILRIYDGPFRNTSIDEFFAELANCYNSSWSPKKLPTVEEIVGCESIGEKISTKNQNVKANKFEILGDGSVAFKMLRSNESHLEAELDSLRKNPKKFICLNDNFDHTGNRTLELRLRQILKDFYTSLFPAPSPFELPDKSFATIEDYKQSSTQARRFTNLNLLFIVLNVIFLILIIWR